jgi:hypothetical protein
VDNAAAFYNFVPGATDIIATSEGTTPTALANILDVGLADNGGPQAGLIAAQQPIPTHDLASPASPAVDGAPNAACNDDPVDGLDQRGFVRNFDGDGAPSIAECDIGAIEYGSAPPPVAIFLTAAGPGTTDDGLDFGKEDILFWNGINWVKPFDGTDEGLTTKHDINAIHINGSNDLYLSFFQNKIKVTDVGSVLGHDILHFDGNGFTFFFDGSDVGLTTTSEKVDALHIVEDPPAPYDTCDVYLLLSTLGTAKVPGLGTVQGEDVLGFCASSTGANTAGTWHLLLDGSDEGMPKNSTDSLSANDDGSVIYLTTKDVFNVDAASGGHSMVYRFDTTSGDFSGPHFSAPADGLHEKVDGLHVASGLP